MTSFTVFYLSEEVTFQKIGTRKSFAGRGDERTTSVSNSWLAERLDMGKAASASQFARRFTLSKQGEKAVDRLILSRVKT